jgi:hypothetical protein
MILVHNIKWDELDYDETDIEVIQQFNELPTDVLLGPVSYNDLEIEDYLCKTYGWAVSTFDISVISQNEYYRLMKEFKRVYTLDNK